jgi:uroporphyrin-III C-methyltransferase / precorrin-2 dehydrogenase / sirohydrochlorin ferrochelatase
MTLFPTFLKLAGRRVLIVGGGPVAASKVAALQRSGAELRVVAPDVCEAIAASVNDIARRPFVPEDLDDVWFVVAAGPSDVNRTVAMEAERRRLFVNAVDDPANASAYLGGVVERGGTTIAISTDGAAPALAGLLRQALDAVLPSGDEMNVWLARAGEMRRSWRAQGTPMASRRPQLLDALNALYDQTVTGAEQ